MNAGGPDGQLEVSLAVYDSGAVAVERVYLPPRAAGEIDLAISAAAICGSDLHTVLGHRAAPARTALGHEGVGRIVDIDHGAVDLRGTALSRGDRVVFALFSSCGNCDRCAAGLPMKCRSLVKYGHESVMKPPHATGTLASHVRLLPGVPVLRIPADIDDAAAVSAGCAVATAAAIITTIGALPERTRVLVLGAGAVGVYTTAMLTSAGHAVHVRDPLPERLTIVEAIGATTGGPDPGSDDRLVGTTDVIAPDGSDTFPVVVEASGSPRAFVDAVMAADTGGHVVAAGSVSPGNSTVSLDPAVLVTRRITLSGVHNYTADDFRRGVDWLLAHGRDLGLERLHSPALPLSEVSEGFRRMHAGRHPRVLIRPDAVGSSGE